MVEVLLRMENNECVRYLSIVKMHFVFYFLSCAILCDFSVSLVFVSCKYPSITLALGDGAEKTKSWNALVKEIPESIN